MCVLMVMKFCFFSLATLLAGSLSSSAGAPPSKVPFHTGNTAFFLQDSSDGQCLGPQGFSICDESAVWVITPRAGAKNYSFVSLFSWSCKGLCLEVKRNWFDQVQRRVGLGSCSSKSSKNWNFKFTSDSNGLMLLNGDLQLARGAPFRNSLTVRSDHPTELRYQPTTIHEAGFYIKSSDGLCFDGDYFRSCNDPVSLLWGVGIKYGRRGEAKRFLHNFKDRTVCLEAKGSRVYRGSCQSRFSSGWSLAQGKLQFDSGHLLDRMVFGSPQCVVRREISGEGRNLGVGGSINGTAAMRPCKESFEYLLMELPTTFSSEDLRKILKEDTERLSTEERKTIEEMLVEMTVSGDAVPTPSDLSPDRPPAPDPEDSETLEEPLQQLEAEKEELVESSVESSLLV